MPEWIVHIGNWMAIITAGGLGLIGVIIALKGISRQIKASHEQQMAEFRDRDLRDNTETWKHTQVSAAAVLSELELQYQMIFQRDISEELEIFCNSIKNKHDNILIPQGYDIYDPSRIFGKMETHVFGLPSWLVTFVVRYMGLLYFELTRFIQTIDMAKKKEGLVHNWDISSIEKFRAIEKSFDRLGLRCEQIMKMLQLITKSSRYSDFQKKIHEEHKKIAQEMAK